jgi:hypothetical protein
MGIHMRIQFNDERYIHENNRLMIQLDVTLLCWKQPLDDPTGCYFVVLETTAWRYNWMLLCCVENNRLMIQLDVTLLFWKQPLDDTTGCYFVVLKTTAWRYNWMLRMVSSGMLRRVFLRSLRRLLVAACVVPSSPILVTLMKAAPGSSETSDLTRPPRRNTPQDTIHHSHRLGNLKSYDWMLLYCVGNNRLIQLDFTLLCWQLYNSIIAVAGTVALSCLIIDWGICNCQR